jgi:hypothetical protein
MRNAYYHIDLKPASRALSPLTPYALCSTLPGHASLGGQATSYNVGSSATLLPIKSRLIKSWLKFLILTFMSRRIWAIEE